jgi:hypothetical protein
MTAAGGEGGIRVSVAHYSAEELIRQFLALYNCMDFKAILEDMGVGRFHFVLRRKALREIRALSIALWGIALMKSFPHAAEEVFAQFRAEAPLLADGGKEARRLQKSIDIYAALLGPKKDADFLPVAEFLAGKLIPASRDLPRQRLKLSLIVRNLYTLIFDKLV